MGTEPEVSDTEHISFLTYWLIFFVFCSSSLQVAVKFSNLAIHLHRGEDIGLGRLILASLYESLNVASIDIKLPQDGNEYLLTSGPLWLFQFWLNATFQHKINQDVPFDTPMNIEGHRLNLITPEDDQVSTTEAFDIWFRMFSQHKRFLSTMAPFASRKCGPGWFQRKFPPLHPTRSRVKGNMVSLPEANTPFLSTP